MFLLKFPFTNSQAEEKQSLPFSAGDAGEEMPLLLVRRRRFLRHKCRSSKGVTLRKGEERPMRAISALSVTDRCVEGGKRDICGGQTLERIGTQVIESGALSSTSSVIPNRIEMEQ